MSIIHHQTGVTNSCRHDVTIFQNPSCNLKNETYRKVFLIRNKGKLEVVLESHQKNGRWSQVCNQAESNLKAESHSGDRSFIIIFSESRGYGQVRIEEQNVDWTIAQMANQK
jgi:hypothetical protein